MHLNKSVRWLVLKVPLFKHGTTSISGGQALYNCAALAFFQRTLCHKEKKTENFASAKFRIPEKVLI